MSWLLNHHPPNHSCYQDSICTRVEAQRETFYLCFLQKTRQHLRPETFQETVGITAFPRWSTVITPVRVMNKKNPISFLCLFCLWVPPWGPVFTVRFGTPKPKIPSKEESNFKAWLTINRRLLFLVVAGHETAINSSFTVMLSFMKIMKDCFIIQGRGCKYKNIPIPSNSYRRMNNIDHRSLDAGCVPHLASKSQPLTMFRTGHARKPTRAS